MNSASTKRLISRQEALVLLGNLDLYLCSEIIKTVSLLPSKRITTSDNPSESKAFLKQYETRPLHMEHMTLYEYFRFKHADRGTHLKAIVPHFVGICGYPTYPVTESYAKQTLLVHRPWRTYPKQTTNWIAEFNTFINLPDAPPAATMPYLRALERHITGTKFVETVAAKPTLTDSGIPPETQEFLELCGLGNQEQGKERDYDVELLQNLDRGQHHTWDADPIVSYFHIEKI